MHYNWLKIGWIVGKHWLAFAFPFLLFLVIPFGFTSSAIASLSAASPCYTMCAILTSPENPKLCESEEVGCRGCGGIHAECAPPPKAGTPASPTAASKDNAPQPAKAPPPASPANEATSLTAAGDTANSGLIKTTQEKANVDDALAFLEAAKQKNLAAAQQALRDRAGGSTGASNADILHDAAIVNRAVSLYDQDKPISKQDVSQAVFPEVREDLGYVLNAQTFSDKLEKKEIQLEDQISGLTKMASTAFQRSQGLDSLKSDNGAAQLVSNRAGSERATSTIATAPADSQIENGGAGEKGTEGKSVAELERALAQMKGVKNSPLRDRLRKKLLAARAAEDAKNAALKSANNGDLFEGKLTAAGAGTDSAQGAGASLAAQAVSSALHSSSEQERFSLAGPETDAAVQRLMRNPSGTEVAASNDASVLSANSLSLFERVRAAHTHCLKQHCVQAN